jgi:general secretion pathway protein D
MSSPHTKRSAWLAVMLAVTTGAATAQQAEPPAQVQANAPAGTAAGQSAQTAGTLAAPVAQKKPVSRKDQRRATKLFLEASKLFEKEQFDEAMRDFERAAALNPDNPNYEIAAKLARSHEVTKLIQTAARARTQNDSGAALEALEQARKLDPGNAQVAEHLRGLSSLAAAGQAKPLYERAASDVGEAPDLEPATGLQSFHLKTDRRQLIQKVFSAYGIQATLDTSVPAVPVKLDLDDVTFQQAVRALGMVTDSFWVPLDAHRVLVARDTRANHEQFERLEMETVYLPGLSAAEVTTVSNLAKNVFNAQQAVSAQNLGTMTIRAPASSLNAFNATLRDLLDGRSQVLLDVRMIQLAHSSQRNTGVQLPQQITAFNVYAQEQAILNANQALVQEIIASGLASPGDTLAILGILLAAGQISGSIFSNGIALFGGGLTLTGLSIPPTTLNLNVNSSATRTLDQVQVRLGDGEEGTLRNGMRYPIMTSSFSGLFGNTPNIPGLTSVGTSSSLSSLLSSYSGAATSIPQVEYQDLGMTLKTTPKVMRNGDVALSLDLKITALAGPVVNGIPVLSNRNLAGVITIKEGSGVVVVSELDKQESRALSGMPGITEIPGLDNLTAKDVQQNYATLVIIMTPHVIRGPQFAGHSPMMRMESGVGGP